ncbi:MAG: hypothetical protein IKC35_02475 [Clostridia bacterium]|nr:hypothetical protein [Clostridia bacterium]
MNETEAFIKYEKTTTMLDISSKILAATMFLALVVSSILGFALYGTTNFTVCFYVAAAAGVIYAFVAMPIWIITQRRRDNVELCRSYQKVLGRNPSNAVAEIREATGVKDEKIVENFARLEALGFFDEIFIDKQNKIVNCGHLDKKKCDFVCHICGGKNEKSGIESEKCGFCGAIAEREEGNYGN